MSHREHQSQSRYELTNRWKENGSHYIPKQNTYLLTDLQPPHTHATTGHNAFLERDN